MTTRKDRTRAAALTWPKEGCEAQTQGGLPCTAPPIKGTRLCYMHTPSLAAERAEAHKRGGRARAYGLGTPAAVNTIEDIRLKLCGVLGRLEAMDSTTEVCRAMITCLVELRSTLSAGELEQRLAALERAWAEGHGSVGSDSVFRPAQQPAETVAGDSSGQD